MKRLILLLGSGWALIYVTNHVLLPSTPSNTKTDVATAPEPISTDRRIDSWGAYLPQFGSEPDAHRPTPPSHLRQPREVAALEGDAEKSNNETSSTNSAKTIDAWSFGFPAGVETAWSAVAQGKKGSGACHQQGPGRSSHYRSESRMAHRLRT